MTGTTALRSRGRILPLVAGAFLFNFFALAQETNHIDSLASLQSKLADHLEQPHFASAVWSAKVISLDTGLTLFEHHPDRLMSPASNCKLFTGALALDRFGGDYRIATPVYATAKPDSRGTVKGDLIISGRGDPSWNSRRLGTNFWALLEPVVSAIAKAGVRQVNGDIIADATFFHGQPTAPGWMVDDLEWGEAAELSPLTLNDNLVQVSVVPGAASGSLCSIAVMQPAVLSLSNCAVSVSARGPRQVELYWPFGGGSLCVVGSLPVGASNEVLDVPVPRPASWFAAELKEALQRHRIKVSGKTRSVFWPQPAFQIPAGAVKLGEVFSPPLREVIAGFMKPSQNLETDLLLAHVGEMARDPTTPASRSSEEAGLVAMRQFLSENGLPVADVHFDEGSGLSDHNLTSANAIVALLQFMARHKEAQSFIDSLPVAGVDGTLRRRMRDTPAAGNVRAKTGTLRWCNSLSGYVISAAGERLAFSFILNRFAPPSNYNRRDDLDAAAIMLAEFSGHSKEAVMTLEKAWANLGRLVRTNLASAPFPDPAREHGYTYHGKFYSAKDHYSDNTVLFFIPRNFRETDSVDFVVHFHGWNHVADGTLDEYKLPEQFAKSGKNAVLIVPQGPLNAPDSFGGKLESTNAFHAFMEEALSALKASGAIANANATFGRIILSGHSGGYHVMSAILHNGDLAQNIKEVWLFDALYGGTENFVGWQKAQDGRLLNIYTDHGGTRQETEKLMSSLKTANVGFFKSEDLEANAEALQTNKIVFLHSALPHNDVVAKRRTFEEFLRTSCLENAP